MAGVLKQSTFLTGLHVAENPKLTLNRLYNRILKLLTKMPESSAYRRHTQEIINKRSAIINSTNDIKTMEDQIACGQIEEVIVQARQELKLASDMLIYSPWENLKTPIPKNQWKWPVN